MLASTLTVMTANPYEWTPTGLPRYRSGRAPAFLQTEAQLAGMGLEPGGDVRAYVDSQYEPVRLYLITEARLSDPAVWPPQRSQ